MVYTFASLPRFGTMLTRLFSDAYSAAFELAGKKLPQDVVLRSTAMPVAAAFKDKDFQATHVLCTNMLCLYLYGKDLCPAVVIHNGDGACEAKLVTDRLAEPHRALLLMAAVSVAESLAGQSISESGSVLDLRPAIDAFRQFAADQPEGALIDPEIGLSYTAAEYASKASGIAQDLMNDLFSNSPFSFMPSLRAASRSDATPTGTAPTAPIK